MYRFPSSCLLLLALCLSQLAVEQSSAGALKWPSEYAGGVKDYLVNLAKTKVISNNEVLRSFNEAMERVKERYAVALEGMSDEAKKADGSTIYYKMVIEEMRELREKYEPLVEQKAAEQQLETEDDDADESELVNELDKRLEDLEREESEMGFGISAENKAVFKQRTMAVISDLLNNEFRQLALAILSSYMTGSSMAPMVVALNSALRYKLVQYLMNTMLDILKNSFGKQIQVTPLNPTPPPAANEAVEVAA